MLALSCFLKCIFIFSIFWRDWKKEQNFTHVQNYPCLGKRLLSECFPGKEKQMRNSTLFIYLLLECSWRADLESSMLMSAVRHWGMNLHTQVSFLWLVNLIWCSFSFCRDYLYPDSFSSNICLYMNMHICVCIYMYTYMYYLYID